MVILVLRAAFLYLSLVYMLEVLADDFNDNSEIRPFEEEELPDTMPYEANEKYIRHIHSMINALKGDDDEQDKRMVIEANALFDTKYKTWKRNANLINTLLQLPKNMNNAGR